MVNPTLALERVNAFYGDSRAVRDLSLEVNAGEVLCLFGRNGAGKSTTLKAIMGLVRARGSIRLAGRHLDSLPAHAVARLGVGYVPQGRRLFAELTVAENLDIGALARPASPQQRAQTRAQALALFPPLASRLGQVAGTLSGGEQQMLAMARALCLAPDVLLLDEPTEGLMPLMIATIREVIATLRARGVAILLVEQRVEAALPLADRIAFIENGALMEVVSAAQLRAAPELLRRYVGVAGTEF